MIEDDAEAGLLMGRLRTAVENGGLRGSEAEALLGLAAGDWNRHVLGRPLAAMSQLQETRARLCVQLMNTMATLLGGWEHVGPWLRTPRMGLQSPLQWSAERLDQLRALVIVAADEVVS